MLYGLIVFLPLVGAAVAGIFGHWLGNRGSQMVTTGLVTAAALLSLAAFWFVALQGQVAVVEVLPWISSGGLEANWTVRVDQLTAVMLVVVTSVSAVVHWYSIGYMHNDPHNQRFFAYLSLFTFAMLALVTADNFLQMFFGWEGVGLCSYLLIGFWYEKPSANAAAIKAFIVNRVGDFGFALGICGVFLVFQTISFEEVFQAVPRFVDTDIEFLGGHFDTLTVLTMLLFVGAMGKSAQIGLHTWLPDAMEGPTPVSALIHAATMVTAGVFMVARLSPMFEYAEFTLMVVTIVGALTAIMAATIGLVQNDIKRVIAYSTCSQLGYMFFACGVSAYSAGIFHLFTHAFFKALLFLGAGSVIHAFSGEQDMRRMGGVWRMIPLTYALMWIGSLALAGMPLFAGFYSKDVILEAAWGAHSGAGQLAFVLGIVAAALTAFYSWRLLFLTFHGKSRADHDVLHHVHESPPVMTVPLMVLAVGAVFAGMIFAPYFVGEDPSFWGESIFVLEGHTALENAHHAPLWVKLAPTVVAVLGIVTAWWMYVKRPEIPVRLAAANGLLYRFFLNKWYFDELYDLLFVRAAKAIGTFFWHRGDERTIDRFGPNGVAARVMDIARRATRLQTGYVYHYAFVMLAGLVLFVSWYLVSAGL
ncbi:MAG: NADH-quinone oxidoreductase subunit L [Alphaproteobacteria bacterium]|nr:NADH-quinone oxidoreductase subunit L [Alphaproteobacteria bacterium]